MSRIELHVPKNWNGILVIGEFPHRSDFSKGVPFRSGQGMEIQRLLAKVGIHLKECAATYTFKSIPKGKDIKGEYTNKTAVKKGEGVEYAGKFITHRYLEAIEELQAEVSKLEPTAIICFGEAALFGLLGESGIDDFRGSMECFKTAGGKDIITMPTHSPVRINKQPHLRYLVSRDLTRVAEHYTSGVWPEPDWDITINPTFPQAYNILHDIWSDLESGTKVELGVDIETRRRFYIGTIGFAWSCNEALVVPFIRPDWTPYWEDAEEEFQIIELCKKILEHENAKVAGQNYHYDAQYLARHWGVRSHIWCDTMVAHHCCFTADIPKALHVLSSIYCEHHQYWKDESHGEGDDKWEPSDATWDSYLYYNGKDCCKTLDVARVLMGEGGALEAMGAEDAWQFQWEMWLPLLKCMLLGNRYDWDERGVQRKSLENQMKVLEDFMWKVVPESLMPKHPKTPFFKSPTQLKKLFYTVLAQPVVTKKNANKMWVPTTEDSALKVIAKREPILKPLCEAIQIYRSMRVFYDNFLTGKPDYDDYLRSGYLLAGTSTVRLASRGDVFDFGLNLQNLPKGDG